MKTSLFRDAYLDNIFGECSNKGTDENKPEVQADIILKARIQSQRLCASRPPFNRPRTTHAYEKSHLRK